MAFKIGFASKSTEHPSTQAEVVPPQSEPRKSVVQVLFLGSNRKLAYYNDRFDLHCGDLVFVDGKLAGQRGRVVDVNYNFKINLSEYKRVIAVADINVHGQFYMAGSHFVTFDRAALPAAKAATWFIAPEQPDDEYVSGTDGSSFPLDNLAGLRVSSAVAERGHDYYMENRVRYLSVDGNRGYAIVEGTQPYEVEFEYHAGQISALTCSCFCSYTCKHAFAAMLQLRETLEQIEAHFAERYASTGYFAAVNKATLFAFVIDGNENGSFIL